MSTHTCLHPSAQSCLYALALYPALLAVIGPYGDFGNVRALCAKKNKTDVAPEAPASDVKVP